MGTLYKIKKIRKRILSLILATCMIFSQFSCITSKADDFTDTPYSEVPYIYVRLSYHVDRSYGSAFLAGQQFKTVKVELNFKKDSNSPAVIDLTPTGELGFWSNDGTTAPEDNDSELKKYNYNYTGYYDVMAGGDNTADTLFYDMIVGNPEDYATPFSKETELKLLPKDAATWNAFEKKVGITEDNYKTKKVSIQVEPYSLYLIPKNIENIDELKNPSIITTTRLLDNGIGTKLKKPGIISASQPLSYYHTISDIYRYGEIYSMPKVNMYLIPALQRNGYYKYNINRPISAKDLLNYYKNSFYCPGYEVKGLYTLSEDGSYYKKVKITKNSTINQEVYPYWARKKGKSTIQVLSPTVEITSSDGCDPYSNYKNIDFSKIDDETLDDAIETIESFTDTDEGGTIKINSNNMSDITSKLNTLQNSITDKELNAQINKVLNAVNNSVKENEGNSSNNSNNDDNGSNSLIENGLNNICDKLTSIRDYKNYDIEALNKTRWYPMGGGHFYEREFNASEGVTLPKFDVSFQKAYKFLGWRVQEWSDEEKKFINSPEYPDLLNPDKNTVVSFDTNKKKQDTSTETSTEASETNSAETNTEINKDVYEYIASNIDSVLSSCFETEEGEALDYCDENTILDYLYTVGSPSDEVENIYPEKEIEKDEFLKNTFNKITSCIKEINVNGTIIKGMEYKDTNKIIGLGIEVLKKIKHEYLIVHEIFEVELDYDDNSIEDFKDEYSDERHKQYVIDKFNYISDTTTDSFLKEQLTNLTSNINSLNLKEINKIKERIEKECINKGIDISDDDDTDNKDGGNENGTNGGGDSVDSGNGSGIEAESEVEENLEKWLKSKEPKDWMLTAQWAPAYALDFDLNGVTIEKQNTPSVSLNNSTVTSTFSESPYNTLNEIIEEIIESIENDEFDDETKEDFILELNELKEDTDDESIDSIIDRVISNIGDVDVLEQILEDIENNVEEQPEDEIDNVYNDLISIIEEITEAIENDEFDEELKSDLTDVLIEIRDSSEDEFVKETADRIISNIENIDALTQISDDIENHVENTTDDNEEDEEDNTTTQENTSEESTTTEEPTSEENENISSEENTSEEVTSEEIASEEKTTEEKTTSEEATSEESSTTEEPTSEETDDSEEDTEEDNTTEITTSEDDTEENEDDEEESKINLTDVLKEIINNITNNELDEEKRAGYIEMLNSIKTNDEGEEINNIIDNIISNIDNIEILNQALDTVERTELCEIIEEIVEAIENEEFDNEAKEEYILELNNIKENTNNAFIINSINQIIPNIDNVSVLNQILENVENNTEENNDTEEEYIDDTEDDTTEDTSKDDTTEDFEDNDEEETTEDKDDLDDNDDLEYIDEEEKIINILKKIIGESKNSTLSVESKTDYINSLNELKEEYDDDVIIKMINDIISNIEDTNKLNQILNNVENLSLNNIIEEIISSIEDNEFSDKIKNNFINILNNKKQNTEDVSIITNINQIIANINNINELSAISENISGNIAYTEDDDGNEEDENDENNEEEPDNQDNDENNDEINEEDEDNDEEDISELITVLQEIIEKLNNNTFTSEKNSYISKLTKLKEKYVSEDVKDIIDNIGDNISNVEALNEILDDLIAEDDTEDTITLFNNTLSEIKDLLNNNTFDVATQTEYTQKLTNIKTDSDYIFINDNIDLIISNISDTSTLIQIINTADDNLKEYSLSEIVGNIIDSIDEKEFNEDAKTEAVNELNELKQSTQNTTIIGAIDKILPDIENTTILKQILEEITNRLHLENEEDEDNGDDDGDNNGGNGNNGGSDSSSTDSESAITNPDDPYTYTFNNNLWIDNPYEKFYVAAKQYITIPKPERPGYDFMGWKVQRYIGDKTGVTVAPVDAEENIYYCVDILKIPYGTGRSATLMACWGHETSDDEDEDENEAGNGDNSNDTSYSDDNTSSDNVGTEVDNSNTETTNNTSVINDNNTSNTNDINTENASSTNTNDTTENISNNSDSDTNSNNNNNINNNINNGDTNNNDKAESITNNDLNDNTDSNINTNNSDSNTNTNIETNSNNNITTTNNDIKNDTSVSDKKVETAVSNTAEQAVSSVIPTYNTVKREEVSNETPTKAVSTTEAIITKPIDTYKTEYNKAIKIKTTTPKITKITTKAKTITIKTKGSTIANKVLVEYSTDKNFKNSKIIKKAVSKGKTTTTIKKLKKNTKYYIRIRYYTYYKDTASNKSFTMYSKYSKTKNKKVKK